MVSVVGSNPVQAPNYQYTPGDAVGSVQAGYNAALGNAQNALTASTNTTSGELGELSQNLGQQQSNIAQNLTNRGLGNTTVSATAQQAPMQNYNNAVANVMNQGSIRTMGADQNLAQLNAQAGNSIGGMMGQFAQAGLNNQANAYANQNAQQQAAANAYQMSLSNAINAMNAQAGGGMQGSQGPSQQGLAGGQYAAPGPQTSGGQMPVQLDPSSYGGYGSNGTYPGSMAAGGGSTTSDDEDD